ncbi:hypothetical protein C8J55DRAFT_565970 [Lentinula edodes]|uniref:Uncharacterized protein n=1 Tax=Lentinula lateritia TaxID=40482 RepID=A0A9W9DEC9_9AGAR|nr:hypothetical protein C8J55DRAFT_565970 [Lentinula edodes]
MCGLQLVLAVFHLFSLKFNVWELLLLLKSESKQLSEALKQAKEFQKALDDLVGKAHPGIEHPQAMDVDDSSFDMSMATNEDDDEDVGEGQTGDLAGMTIDVQDVLHFRRWERRRKYKNAQTWKNQVDNFNNAWASLIDEMTEAYIKWKYNLDSPDNFNEEYSFKIDAVNVYTLEKEVCIHRSKNTKAAVALVSAGYLGTSPEFPSLAISLQTLELYYTLHLFKPSFSIEAFAKALCHLFPSIGAIYLSEDFVNINAGEIKARLLARNIEDEDPDELQSNWIDEEHGDPTDGIEDSELVQCTENWKAAAANQQKKMWGISHESEYFASACRHGFVFWVADMIRSGELAKYPLAIVAKALEVLLPHWLMGYNIGCSFGGTILRSSLGLEFAKQKCRTCVNAFHGYSHNAARQQKYHPLNILGMGLENLETLEQLFSLSQWDREKYQNLATMLHNNYVQALNILEDEAKALQADLVAKGITIEDLKTYFVEESNHLKEIGKEAEGDLHAVVSACDNAAADFCSQTPADYEFLASTASYSRNLSDRCWAETKQWYLREQRDKTLFEVGVYEHQKIPTGTRAALQTYNSAATAIGRPTLDWHSRQEMADAVVQHLMKQHRQVACAKEEIQHCNVQIRRLQTSILDEDKKFHEVLENLKDTSMYYLVHDFIDCQCAVNQLLLSHIYQTQALPSFTGNRNPRVHEGSGPPTSTSVPMNLGLPDPDSDDREDADDDEIVDGMGAC